MKRFLLMLCCLVIAANAAGIDFKQTTDYAGLQSMVVDSSKPASYWPADSVQITVVFHGATNSGLCLQAWYDPTEAQCDLVNGQLSWWDQIADIDADSGSGLYTVMGRFFDDSLDADYYQYYSFYLGPQNVNVASVSNNAINLTYDVAGELADSNVAPIVVIVQDTTNSGKKVGLMPGYWTAADSAAFQGSASGLDSLTVYLAAAQANSDSLMTQAGLDSLIDSLCSGIIAGLDSTQTANLVAQVLSDSSGLLGRAVWRTLLAPYDTANGTFGQMNNGSAWFDPAVDVVVPTDTTVSGRTFAAQATVDLLLLRQLFHLRVAGFWPGTSFYYVRYATVDTLIIVDTVSTDTLLYQIRKHPAGPAGAVPDSGLTAAGPDF